MHDKFDRREFLKIGSATTLGVGTLTTAFNFGVAER